MPKAQTQDPEQAWLGVVPVPAVAHEAGEDGAVVLLRPKFLSPRLAWLQRLMWKPFFRVRLDAPGSRLWLDLDGRRSLAELAQLQRAAFGEAAEPAEARAVAFVQQLARGGFVKLLQPSAPDTPATT